MLILDQMFPLPRGQMRLVPLCDAQAKTSQPNWPSTMKGTRYSYAPKGACGVKCILMLKYLITSCILSRQLGISI